MAKSKQFAYRSARTGRFVLRPEMRLASNTMAGVIGVGLGTASAVGVSPIVIPAAIAGGAAAYFLSNQIRDERVEEVAE